MTEDSPRARVSLAFLQGKDASIQSGGKAIVSAMTGNPEFPHPPVNLSDLDRVLDSYKDAITACTDGGKLATATRKSLRVLVTKDLRLLGAYVESVANGDEAIIRSSGFDSWIYARAQPQHLEMPAPVKIKQGNSGEFYITITRVEGAKSIKLRSGVAGTDPETWQSQGRDTRPPCDSDLRTESRRHLHLSSQRARPFRLDGLERSRFENGDLGRAEY